MIHAVGVIKEYKNLHSQSGYRIDEETVRRIQSTMTQFESIKSTAQVKTTAIKYFKDTQSNLEAFSSSRASVRHYSGANIPVEVLTKALDLARSTPSACNRQSWRTYVYTNKDRISRILELQGGSSGFGHLTNKLIVVVADINCFDHCVERHQAFIDGGMYCMNLLYALHVR